MILGVARRDFVNLQDRCRAEIMKRIHKRNDLNSLKLPYMITQYLGESLKELSPLKQVDNFEMFST